MRKIGRVLTYYMRLIRYAAVSEAAVFHVLWNNRFEGFDRTILTLYYKLCGKRVVLTAHNVNAAKRDAKDTWSNRFTLRVQYQLVDHIFVHTTKLRDELQRDFAVPASKIGVVPFGINNTVQQQDQHGRRQTTPRSPCDGSSVAFFRPNCAL